MNLRTAGVKQLVSEVLASLPEPHTEDVIADLFQEIEQRPALRQRYDDLCAALTKTMVNKWCGVWTERLVGGTGFKQVQATSTTLIESYSKLVLDGSNPHQRITTAAKSRTATSPRVPTQKITEAAAAQMMSDYFQKNRAMLPLSVRKHRERLIELLMAGSSAEEAFSVVIS